MATALLLVPLASGCWGEAPSPASAPPSEGQAARRAPTRVPTWVPPNTPQQALLLTPLQRAIKSPAQRVFPDLDRFGYANNRPLADTADAIKFTRMVTQVLKDSPRFYALDELPPGAANPITQYGPTPGEPDGFKIPTRDAEGIGQLVAAPGAEEARAALARGAELAKGGDLAGAIEAYRVALTKLPRVPALRLALASALARAGRSAEADIAYRATLSLDPTFAPAHLGLAELANRRGDKVGARKALVEALAYDPPSRRALELLRSFDGTGAGAPSAADGGWYDTPKEAAPAGPSRADPFPVFLDVDSAGAIHVASGKSDAAQIYGGCRAVMRYEPSLRAQIFQQPAETPYYLSVAEEVVCLEAGLGAYAAGKGERTDPDLDRLLLIAHEDGLSGYVMFEILGQHRPERARTAPPDVHRDTVLYLEKWVLGRRDAPVPDGVYTAKR